MPEPYPLRFIDGKRALARDLTDPSQLAAAVQGFGPPRPVLVLVGGANSLQPDVARRIGPMFRDSLIPLLERTGAAVIDGGTASGVMALIGQSRANSDASFPLIGIAARGTVRMPGDAATSGYDRPWLEPDHSHFLLVPGDRWGDESPWISAAADILASGAPSATLAAGGGQITKLDLALGLQAGRQTLLLTGSGGVTGDLSRALGQRDLGAFDIEPVQAGLLRAVDLSNACAVLDELLSGAPAL